MTPTDWTAEKCQALEAKLGKLARYLATTDATALAESIGQGVLMLQTQRNLLAAAHARIAELETLVAQLARPLATGSSTVPTDHQNS